jgi:hypothetical protein
VQDALKRLAESSILAAPVFDEEGQFQGICELMHSLFVFEDSFFHLLLIATTHNPSDLMRCSIHYVTRRPDDAHLKTRSFVPPFFFLFLTLQTRHKPHNPHAIFDSLSLQGDMMMLVRFVARLSQGQLDTFVATAQPGKCYR